jgi:hypothetical protein
MQETRLDTARIRAARRVPLLFAAGIFVGMVATFILFFVGIEIYCSHGHMAECT